MALPKSGTSDSNVLKLEDIRNKHKKSKRTNKSRRVSLIEEDTRTQAAGFETEVLNKNEFESALERSGSGQPPYNSDGSDDDIISTPAKRSLVSNRRFNKVKVERIKSELAEGKYTINYLRIADKFIEHERFG